MTTKPSITDRMNAANLLGVSLGAGTDEVKQAWRKAAFEKHPDRGGCADAFSALSDAYRVLLETAPKSATPQPIKAKRPTTRMPSRPVVQKRTETTTATSKAQCMEILRALSVQGQVAVESRRSGRNVSYFFEEPIQQGMNHVSVDTGDFVRRAKPKPVHVAFEASHGDQTIVELSDDKLAENFPGARRVRLHFATDAEAR